jgi:hypothetical protein
MVTPIFVSWAACSLACLHEPQKTYYLAMDIKHAITRRLNRSTRDWYTHMAVANGFS